MQTNKMFVVTRCWYTGPCDRCNAVADLREKALSATDEKGLQMAVVDLTGWNFGK